MSRIIRVKNATETEKTYCGQVILSGEYYTIASTEISTWQNNTAVFAAIASGELVVNKGTDDTDDLDPIVGWDWLFSETFLKNQSLGGKLAVHSSSKPEPPGVQTYVVWSGAGDDLSTPGDDNLGMGPLLVFNMNNGAGTVETIDVKFDPAHGRVWIHEAYVKFANGGVGDYISVDIIAPATPLVEATGSPLLGSPDVIVDDGWVKYSPQGPGTGTHILTGTPALLTRSFSKDGDWDYDGVTLTPNMTGTGMYKMTAIERIAHRYLNRIPCLGTTNNYFTLSSDESAELPVNMGYFARVHCHNVSGNQWTLSALMEIFRERTIVP